MRPLGGIALLFLATCASPSPKPPREARVSGELKRWHRVTVTFDGPEAGASNPFLDFRLIVTFRRGSAAFAVPGFFAGGTSWSARFSPSEVGTWAYAASFRAGPGVAVALDPAAGRPVAFDGASGSFQIAESDKVAPDFRAPGRGLLRNRGSHYLTFGGSGKPWIKGGPNIPENFLGYGGFDRTPGARHRFAAHEKDWMPGDPDWGGGLGRGIIGALNYLASTGANCIYFLPMNIGGDGKDTFPTIAEQEKLRYDVHKLEQWETVFAHAQSKGIFLHFQLSETEQENATYHDGGRLGPERTLFYRELIARFGHHNGLEWDLGEENKYGTDLRKAFAARLKALDPYDHPVTNHTLNNLYEQTYAPLLGDGNFDLTGFQGDASDEEMVLLVRDWRRRSTQAGAPWVVSFDEPQRIDNDLDDREYGYPHGRRDKMWPLYIAGGGGFEWFVREDGGGFLLDQKIDDFRIMEPALRWTGIALKFFERLPLLEMEPADAYVSEGWCLAKPGEIYAIYLPRGGTCDVGLGDGVYDVTWLDPRTGEEKVSPTLRGPGRILAGRPPGKPGEDWALLVRRTSGSDHRARPVR